MIEKQKFSGNFGMDSIKDIIPRVVEKMACQRAGAHGALERVWGNIFERQELKHMKLVGPRAGTIMVVVDSPARLYHLRMRKTKILKQLQQELPEIRDITIQVGDIQ